MLAHGRPYGALGGISGTPFNPHLVPGAPWAASLVDRGEGIPDAVITGTIIAQATDVW